MLFDQTILNIQEDALFNPHDGPLFSKTPLFIDPVKNLHSFLQRPDLSYVLLSDGVSRIII